MSSKCWAEEEFIWPQACRRLEQVYLRESGKEIEKIAIENLEFAQFTLRIFASVVLKTACMQTDSVRCFIAMRPTTWARWMRIPQQPLTTRDSRRRSRGGSSSSFPRKVFRKNRRARRALTYLKFPFLKKVGWEGTCRRHRQRRLLCYTFIEIECFRRVATRCQAGIRAVLRSIWPQENRGHYHRSTTAWQRHWARLIRIPTSSERMLELVRDKRITSQDVRRNSQQRGWGGRRSVEAPGHLFHHYESDANGIPQKST